MESYDFSTATQQLYGWWQYELCDVFIELMKPVMARGDAEPGACVAAVLGVLAGHAARSSTMSELLSNHSCLPNLALCQWPVRAAYTC